MTVTRRSAEQQKAGAETVPEAPSESVERDAKEKAASVVIAWRGVDWEAIERGESAPGAAQRAAADSHESVRRFLLDEAGELGRRLQAGLERFYIQDIAARLRRPAVLAALAAPASAAAEEDPTLVPRPRPTVTVGHTVRMNTGCGNLYVTINEDGEGQPFELFNHMGKAGGCAASQNEAIGRLISYAMRCGASVDPLIKQLKGISCHRPAWGEDGKISSCSDAIGKALEKYTAAKAMRTGGASRPASSSASGMVEPLLGPTHGSDAERHREAAIMASAHNGGARRLNDESIAQGACQDCGGQLSFEEGCVKCHSCGYTECG
jgi:hypothetical protein